MKSKRADQVQPEDRVYLGEFNGLERVDKVTQKLVMPEGITIVQFQNTTFDGHCRMHVRRNDEVVAYEDL